MIRMLSVCTRKMILKQGKCTRLKHVTTCTLYCVPSSEVGRIREVSQ